MKSLDATFFKWKGNDNKLWKLSVKRGVVKAIVEFIKDKKLTSKSKKLLQNAHF